jgi:hypothetical protein
MMEGMTGMDWVVLGTKVAMQLTLVVAPIIIALLQKKKVDHEMLVQAGVDAVAIIGKEIVKGQVEKGPAAKTKALELVSRRVRGTKLKGRSLQLVNDVIEGEVARRR